MYMNKQTTWNIKQPAYSALENTMEADVAIIGGGLTGILCAYTLARAGKRVVLLEAATLGSGATVRTTAFITHVIDTSLPELVDMFGKECAKAVWQSGQEAITYLEKIAETENIACEFMRCPAYVYARSRNERSELKEQYAAARRMDFNVTFSHKRDLGFTNSGYLTIEGQAKFHPMKFLRGVAKSAAALGARIYEHSKIIDISLRRPFTLHTKNGKVQAQDIILATYFPFTNPRVTHYKKGMYKSYVIEAAIPSKILPEALYWDLSNPYYYFRVDHKKTADRLILGGLDHRAELSLDPQKRYLLLEHYLTSLLGPIPYTIIRSWSGPILEPSDGLPLIGVTEPHQYVASAFSGNGMTYATAAALIIRDMIMEKKTPWLGVYDPRRTPTMRQLLKKGKDYAQEFVEGVVKPTFK